MGSSRRGQAGELVAARRIGGGLAVEGAADLADDDDGVGNARLTRVAYAVTVEVGVDEPLNVPALGWPRSTLLPVPKFCLVVATRA